MTTVSVHIEGHEDGSIDDSADLATVLRHIAERLMSGTSQSADNIIPEGIVPGYTSPFDGETEPATWSVQYSMY